MRSAMRSTYWWGLAVVLCGLGWPSSAVGETNLKEAYQKEFAHLEAQKRALEQRLRELEDEQSEAVDEAERGRDRLQGELSGLRSERDELQRTLEKLERRDADKGAGHEALASTVEQASTTLEEESVEFEPPGDEPAYADLLPRLFDKGAEAIEQSRAIRIESGSFFLPGGEEIDGEILHVGEIAAYGISEEGAGALAPAGKGRLKLWEEPTAKTARQIRDGEMPESLGMFLYESLGENVEPKEDGGWVEKVNAGGVIGWVIVGLGGLGVLFILIRALTLAWIGSNAARVVRRVSRRVADGNLADARQCCEQAGGAAARVLGTVLDNLARDRDEIEELVAEAMLEEAPRIERFGSAILVLAAVSPLLGLLGTVTGMISTFDIITEFGTGDPRMLSGGISEALVTTQLGLIVAIPLLLVGNLLKGWARKIEGRLERGALRVLNLLAIGADEGSEPDAPSGDVPPPETETDGSREPTDNELLGAIR